MSSASQAYNSLNRTIRTGVTLPIVAYQKTVSFDHGPLKALYPYGYCPFYPSCSEYARQSIMKDGVVKGILKGSWRICRCHPFTEGGIDQP
jgi:putative membrane protein insertion efficiency factor